MDAFESEKAVLSGSADDRHWLMPAAAEGFVLYGPRANLEPGTWTAELQLESLEPGSPPAGWADVASRYGQRQLVAASARWSARSARIELSFETRPDDVAIEIRLFLEQPGRLRIEPIRLLRDPG
jgi:hypothetical protein